MSANNSQPTYVFHIHHYAGQPAGAMWTTATNSAALGKSTMKAPTGGNATRPTNAPKYEGAQRGEAPNHNYSWVFAPATKTTAAVQTWQPAATKNTRWAAFVPTSAQPPAREFGNINMAGFCPTLPFLFKFQLWDITVTYYEADSADMSCHSSMENLVRVQPRS
ncbi:hypothetical protein HOY80DRAFT_1070092 [Tuber brumale]|nr:hypothetical protein HOY80DRAFT_1070092 [Tuber brumale]